MLPNIFPFRQRSFDDTLSLLRLYALACERERELPLVSESSSSSSLSSLLHPLHGASTRSPANTNPSSARSNKESRGDGGEDTDRVSSEGNLLSFVPEPFRGNESSGSVGSSMCSSRIAPNRSVSDAFRYSRPQDDGPSFEIQWGPLDGMDVILRCSATVIGRGSAGTVYKGQLCFRQSVDDLSIDSSSEDAAKPTLILDVAVKVMKLAGGPLGDPASISQGIARRLRAVHSGIVFAYFCTASPTDPHTEKWAPDLSNARTFNLALAMEVASGGSLDARLRREEKLSEAPVRSVLQDILPAVTYLHEELGVVHNDIKPGNILIFYPEEGGNGIGTTEQIIGIATGSGTAVDEAARTHFKLSDFGASRYIDPRCDVVSRLRTAREDTLRASAHGGALRGTAAFMSPESCLGVDDSPTNDVWSIGVTVFQLVTGGVPWKPLESAYPNIILNGFREKFSMGCLFTASLPSNSDGADAAPSTKPPGTGIQLRRMQSTADFATFGPILDEIESTAYSPEVRDFVKKCLAESPLDRPSCKELLQHPFVLGTKL